MCLLCNYDEVAVVALMLKSKIISASRTLDERFECTDCMFVSTTLDFALYIERQLLETVLGVVKGQSGIDFGHHLKVG